MTKKTRTMAEAVVQAKLLQPKLASAADALNIKIAQFEKALKGLNLGVAAGIPLWQSDEDPEGADLRFAKWGGDWHLLVVTWDTYTGDLSEKYELLQNKSREQRIDAVALFPDLVEALLEAAENEIVRVSKSADSIDELINSLKSGAK
jgi:hypothetical protein